MGHSWNSLEGTELGNIMQHMVTVWWRCVCLCQCELTGEERGGRRRGEKMRMGRKSKDEEGGGCYSWLSSGCAALMNFWHEMSLLSLSRCPLLPVPLYLTHFLCSRNKAACHHPLLLSLYQGCCLSQVVYFITKLIRFYYSVNARSLTHIYKQCDYNRKWSLTV
jgi:hypothetical protein